MADSFSGISVPPSPQSIDALQARLPWAVARPVRVDLVLAGDVGPACCYPHHVFDFEGGARLIISRDLDPTAGPVQDAHNSSAGTEGNPGAAVSEDGPYWESNVGATIPRETIHVSAPGILSNPEATVDPFFLALSYFWALLRAEVAPVAYRSKEDGTLTTPHIYFDCEIVMGLVESLQKKTREDVAVPDSPPVTTSESSNERLSKRHHRK